jgi:hypothetical protein
MGIIDKGTTIITHSPSDPTFAAQLGTTMKNLQSRIIENSCSTDLTVNPWGSVDDEAQLASLLSVTSSNIARVFNAAFVGVLLDRLSNEMTSFDTQVTRACVDAIAAPIAFTMGGPRGTITDKTTFFQLDNMVIASVDVFFPATIPTNDDNWLNQGRAKTHFFPALAAGLPALSLDCDTIPDVGGGPEAFECSNDLATSYFISPIEPIVNGDLTGKRGDWRRRECEHKEGALLRRKRASEGVVGGRPPEPPLRPARSSTCAAERMCSRAHVRPSACAAERMCGRAHVRSSACAVERVCGRTHVRTSACANERMCERAHVRKSACGTCPPPPF